MTLFFGDKEHCKRCRKRGHNWINCKNDIIPKYIPITEGYSNIYNEPFEVKEDEYSFMIPLIGYVELCKLNFIPWNNTRYRHNFSIIEKYNNVQPITITFDIKRDRLSILDGNHRSQVCYELGYTYIPAYIELHKYKD